MYQSSICTDSPQLVVSQGALVILFCRIPERCHILINNCISCWNHLLCGDRPAGVPHTGKLIPFNKKKAYRKTMVCLQCKACVVAAGHSKKHWSQYTGKLQYLRLLFISLHYSIEFFKKIRKKRKNLLNLWLSEHNKKAHASNSNKNLFFWYLLIVPSINCSTILR